MGKFCQVLTEFIPDDNFCKYQWIFTKLGMCIDIVEIWFKIVMGKLCQFLTELSD